MCVDHCISLLGAYDGIRFTLPSRPAPLTQFVASMDEISEAIRRCRGRVDQLRDQAEDFLGVTISPEALSRSIRAYNRDRQLLRQLYDLRCGHVELTPTTMQTLVKSSMVMDVEEHTAILEDVVDALARTGAPAPSASRSISQATSAMHRSRSCSI